MILSSFYLPSLIFFGSPKRQPRVAILSGFLLEQLFQLMVQLFTRQKSCGFGGILLGPGKTGEKPGAHKNVVKILKQHDKSGEIMINSYQF